MGQQWDRSYDGQGQPRGPGHTVRAGFGPQGEHPSTRPARTPPQFRPDAPPREDGHRAVPQEYAQPGFTPAYQQPGRAPDPGGDPWAASAGGSWQPPLSPQALRRPYQQPGYPPQQPAWQQPYSAPRYPPGPPPPPSRHTARNVIAVTGGIIGLIIVISVAANNGHGTTSTLSAGPGTQTQAAAPASQSASQAPAQTPADTGPAGTTSELQALAAAQNYLGDGQGFSRQGLIGQLDSPDGDNFSVADATWGVDHSDANWDTQAVDCAKGYMSDGQGFSRQGLIQQMTSSYGNEFTETQAEYAANAVGL